MDMAENTERACFDNNYLIVEDDVWTKTFHPQDNEQFKNQLHAQH